MRIPLTQYSSLLVRYLKPHWPTASLLALLLFGNIGLQLVNPQIMRGFIDTAQSGGPVYLLLRSAILFIGIAVGQHLIAILATYVGENLGWNTTNALRTDLAEHCLRLDMSFQNSHSPGEMIERIDGDVSALGNFFSRFVIQILGNALLMVGVLALLVREDWRVGTALTVFATLALLTLARLRYVAVPQWMEERQANAELFGFLEERLSGTEDIRSCGAKAYVMHGFYQLMRDVMRKSLRAGLMWNVVINASMVLMAVGTALALGTGAYLYRSGVVTIGTVYIIFHYSSILRTPINRITQQMQDVQRAGASIVRVRDLLNTATRITEVETGGSLSGPSGLPLGALAVEFRNVSFGYGDAASQVSKETYPGSGGSSDDTPEDPTMETVLHDLSFRLRPGAVLGLLGRTGSGKTTITRLLFRLYDPDGGSVCLGNPAALMDVREVPLQALRQRVGMVTQNVQLFHATVRDNLTFFDSKIPDQRILDVIRDLGMQPWYQSLSEGLDTLLSSGAGGLSAGEAQLLAFARIFLRDPGLVILDEASSRLDPATERLLERAIDTLVRDRTAIIVAHRLATIDRADEIMILESGRVLEHGLRTGLARDPASRFSSLLRTGLEEVLA